MEYPCLSHRLNLGDSRRLTWREVDIDEMVDCMSRVILDDVENDTFFLRGRHIIIVTSARLLLIDGL